MARMFRFSACLALVLAASCSSADPAVTPEVDAGGLPALEPLPELTAIRTTLDGTFTPQVARQTAADGPNPSLPDALKFYQGMGYGRENPSPAWPRLPRTFDDSAPPAAGPNRKRLTRFVHMPDLQIADDETPSRLALLDMPTQIDAAMRPQDPDLCRMLNAAVRTIRAHHAADPFSFLLLGGDNIDNAQENELSWVLGTLGGSERVKCDSGADDDLVPGPDNDGKDAFASRGLGFPFFWVTGNHDVEVQGNVAVDADRSALTVGRSATNGTRDYTRGGAPFTGDFVVADPRRALMPRTTLMQKVSEHGDGHGLGPEQIASGKAFYAFDLPDSPFRFVILDTAHAEGGADGVLLQRDLDRIVTPLLDQAVTDGKLVFVAAHHSSKSLTSNGGAFGVEEPDPVLEAGWLDYLDAHPEVLASFVGHTHLHQVRALDTGSHGVWEIMTSAIADYPNQFRIIEIFDEDNGYFSIEATAVDYSFDGDAVAKGGREKAVIDYVSGWISGGVGTTQDHNVQLWIKKP